MLTAAMNDTKWNELRLAMYEMDPPPAWSTLVENGHQSRPDHEWFHHFYDGGYQDIIHVDIIADDAGQRALIRAALRKIHVPGEETETGFRIYGYLQKGQTVGYL